MAHYRIWYSVLVCSSPWSKMNGYQGCIFEYLNIWIKFGAEPQFGQNKPCLDKPLFFQNLGKNTEIEVWMDLEAIWCFQIFGYLGIWTERTIMAATQLKTCSKMFNNFNQCTNPVDRTFLNIFENVWFHPIF